MLGIARIAEMGLIAAAAITAAIALLGILAFDISVIFGLLITPITLMLSAGVLAFVVLRHREQPAMTTAAIALVITIAVSVVLVKDVKLILVFTVICWLSALLVASVLRGTVSLKIAVLSTVPLAIIVGLIAQIYKAEIVHYWQYSLRKSLSSLSEAELEQLGDERLTLMLDLMPKLLAESVTSWAFFIVLCGVFIARFWQAQLFNQGGFQKEFHSLRLGKEAVAVFAVAFVLAQLFTGAFWASIASALMFVFFIQGLSVVHCLTRQRGLSTGWLTGMYAILWLPPTMFALSVLGIADNFFQIRKI